MAVPKKVKDLLSSMRARFDFMGQIADGAAATELKAIKTEFAALLERLPKEVGGDKDEEWAAIVARDTQLENNLETLKKRIDEYSLLAFEHYVLPRPATFNQILGVVIYAGALIAILLLLIGLFWNWGSSAYAIKSRVGVSRLKADATRAQEKSTAVNEELAKIEERHAAAEKAVLTAVNKGVAKVQPTEEPQDTSGESGGLATPATPEGKAEKSPSTEDESATTSKPTQTPTPLPAEDETEESAPEIPSATPGESPKDESPSDVTTATAVNDAAQDHALRAAKHAAGAREDHEAAKRAAALAAVQANIARATQLSVEKAAQEAVASAAAARDAANAAMEATKAKQKTMAEAVEAPREAAESLRDSVAKEMEAAKEDAEAAAKAEEAAIAKQVEAQAELATEEIRAMPFSVCVFTMCAMFGALGACLRLAGSLGAYIAERKLYRSWLVYYYSMPFEGALVGIAIYLMLGAGLFTPEVEGTDAVPVGNPLFIYALAMLAGTFAKNAMRKLRDIADATFGKPSEKDALLP